MVSRKKKSVAQKKAKIGGLSWFFPTTDHGETHGFADSQLEYFQGDHEKFIARETIQNAVDARLDYDLPVSVVFEKLSMDVSDFPGHDEFLSRLNRCLDFVEGQKNAETFFKSAIGLLKGKKLPVLKISDFNTKGLSGGDEEKDGNWFRLVRAAGISSPKGVAGGSFGIGKGAPFAASSLRTVFYSSVNDKDQLVCQGKARLVSHENEDKDIRQGIGFYGINGYQAIRKNDLIPNIFKRDVRGTDIFVMGYTSVEAWQSKLIKSVLYNFWLAILNGDLEVIFRDKTDIVITKENLHEYLAEYEVNNARFFYESVKSPTQTFEEDLVHLGKVTLFVKKNDGYPGKIMMTRKPKMIVQEKSYRVLREPYAGIFICENDKGNALLRELEPPEHDKWDYARTASGPVAWREMDTFIKKSLKQMAESLTSEPEDIPGLDRYLPDTEDRDNLSPESGIALEETGTALEAESGREVGSQGEYEAAMTGFVSRAGIVTNKQIGTVKHVPPTGPGKGKRGRSTGREEGKDEGVRIKTSSISFRSFVQKTKSGIEYRIAMTCGDEDCEGAIRLVAVGDDGTYPVALESAVDVKTGKKYEIGESLIKGLEIKSGETAKLAVSLESKKKYMLGIETYEG